MAKAKKLPSGNWRVLIYIGTDDNGKRRYKSITASSKKEAELMALEWSEAHSDNEAITVYEAIERYIDVKQGVLSPSTHRSYESILNTHFNGTLGKKDLFELNNSDVQIFVSNLSIKKKLAPKSVRNVYGLLTSAIDMFRPDLKLKITLPSKLKTELYTPSDEDVKLLIQSITEQEFKVAVLLAAFGPLRCGEICALSAEDIKGNFVTVSKSMVKASDGLWYIKQPKTYSSYRKITMPSKVMKEIKKLNVKEGKLLSFNPDQLSSKFKRYIKTLPIHSFRFHDLRHYAASIMHAIGTPDKYIMERGGWATDSVMKTVYQNVIDIESKKQNLFINSHFEDIM